MMICIVLLTLTCLHQAELQELERIWQIDESELSFEHKVGSGSFGEVWLATYQGRQVAVKRVSGSLLELNDRLAISEFTKEMKVR